MATTPYRTVERIHEDPPAIRPSRSLEIAGVAGLVWLVTLARIVERLRSGPGSGDLDLAWVVLFLLPVVIWKELALWMRRDQGAQPHREA